MPLVDMDLREYFCCTLDDTTNTGSDYTGSDQTATASNTARNVIHSEEGGEGDSVVHSNDTNSCQNTNDQGSVTQSMVFDLHGVVCHKGDSLSQGHYVSYALSDNSNNSGVDAANDSCWIR